MNKRWITTTSTGCLFIGCLLAGCSQQQASAQSSTPAATESAVTEANESATTATVEQPLEEEAKPAPEEAEEAAAPAREEKRSAPDRKELEKRYVWLEGRDDLTDLTTLDRKFTPPSGYTRVGVEKNSYQDYLRGLPLRTDRTSVKLYNGESVYMPSKGIIPLDLGKRDLHQCADSVIRLYAEWLWVEDRATEAQFHFTSGDLARWKDWRAGKVLMVKKGKVVQVRTKPTPNTHKAYRRWLDRVFTYASTRSMHRDSKRVEDSKELQAGDFFLMGGSPGHVVILLDVAESKSGDRVALVGQGYLPAREFHVIEGDGQAAVDGVWFKLPSEDREELATPTWKPFSMEHAWRFR